MHHFVQYHNFDKMGPYRTSRKSFGIVTSKCFSSLLGGTAWLVMGKGQPRRYFLCSRFVVDRVERINTGSFLNRATGSSGHDFNVEIGALPWFPKLFKISGSFGLGLQPISSKTIIKGLSLALKASKSQKAKRSVLKALTIRQPWAELILRGRKPFELRTWRTKYRGPLVIHAAAKVDDWGARHFGLNPEKLTTSAFVGFAILSDVRPYTRADARLLKKTRAGYGWFPHNHAWVLTKARRISPVKAKGQLSLFDVPQAVERRIRRLL
jgi:hypothetical protein